MNFGERHHSTQSVQVSAGLVLEVTLRAPLSSWVGSHHPLYSLLTHSFIHSFIPEHLLCNRLRAQCWNNRKPGGIRQALVAFMRFVLFSVTLWPGWPGGGLGAHAAPSPGWAPRPAHD